MTAETAAGPHNGEAQARPARTSSPLDAPPPGRAGEAFQLALAVLRSRAVARLYGGPFGEIATYYPGGRVEGVRVDDDRVEVHIVVRLDLATPIEAAEEVRRVVAPLVAPRWVDVVIEDVEWPGDGSVPATPATPGQGNGVPGNGREDGDSRSSTR